jgi:hypothetical protein
MELSPIGLEYVLSLARILALGLRTREVLGNFWPCARGSGGGDGGGGQKEVSIPHVYICACNFCCVHRCMCVCMCVWTYEQVSPTHMPKHRPTVSMLRHVCVCIELLPGRWGRVAGGSRERVGEKGGGERERESEACRLLPRSAAPDADARTRYDVVYKPMNFELEAEVSDNDVPEVQVRRWHILLFIEGDFVV